MKGRVPKNVSGTCDWFVDDRRYVHWQEALGSLVLWVTGHPGCGKSVLSSYLVNHLERQYLESSTASYVCYFFCNNATKTSDVLCSIIHQILSARPFLFKKYILPELEIKGTKIVTETLSLWHILEAFIMDPETENFVVILDALDECPAAERSQLARLFLNSQIHDLTPMKSAVKVLITSRPYPYIENDMRNFKDIRLRLEDEVKKLDADISRVIESRLEDLRSITDCDEEKLAFIRSRMIAGSDHTFLWLSIVFDLLEKDPEGSKSSIEKVLSDLPTALYDLYDRILKEQLNSELTVKVLSIILAAYRPLTLAEINIAVNVRATDRSFQDLQPRLQVSDVSVERMIKTVEQLFL